MTPPDKPAPIPVEVRGEPGFTLKLESLENRTKGIVVANSRMEGDVHVATVQVPEGALIHFIKVVQQYLTEQTPGTEKTPPKPKHQDLVDRIAEVRLATLGTFWTDISDFPPKNQAMWWEVWVLAPGDQSPWDSFRMLAEAAGLGAGKDTIRFPDRVVGLVYGRAEQLSSSPELLEMIGEVRRAKENPADFIRLTPRDQGDWVSQFLPRVGPPPLDAPAVCLLDAGVVQHPVMRSALQPEDCHRFDPNWPLADDPAGANPDTHGTEMAGMILFGPDLAALLAGEAPVPLRHRLESVRILPPRPRGNERRLFGHITAQSAARVEIACPERRRVFCLPVTLDGRDRWRPSSWSGVIDQLAAGVADGNPRLFVISAGNADENQRHTYPDSNDTDSVQDPAQAWNALAVGAYTSCVRFDQAKYPEYRPVAPCDDLSPCSTTSVDWDPKWPYKPDFVLEGGNCIRLPGTATVLAVEEMAMLTTAHATAGRLLVDFRDTSAAAAQAARMAAVIQAAYPHLWPEAVRALLIHSADWTEPMRTAFGDLKTDVMRRLRRYGYGVPNLGRALHSARNSLTLIAQQAIQPFTRDEGARDKMKDMGLHALPWPRQQLLDLGATEVTLRVTLSYFVEPKPGRRDGFVKSRHRYQSHGLRFEVRRP